MLDWIGGLFAGTRLCCKSSSMMERQMDMAVYLNTRGIIPFMHAAMDPNNILADVLMDCSACAAYALNDGMKTRFILNDNKSIIFGLGRMSAFVYGKLLDIIQLIVILCLFLCVFRKCIKYL